MAHLGGPQFSLARQTQPHYYNNQVVRFCDPAAAGLHITLVNKLEAAFSTQILRKDEIAQEILESLAQFSAQVGMRILDTFLQKDMSTIHNKSGFLAGLMKRQRQNQAAQNQSLYQSYSAMGRGIVNPFQLNPFAMPVAMQPLMQSVMVPTTNRQLSPAVQAKLEAFITAGLLQHGELDSRIIDSLSQFPPQIGEAILDKFAEVDLTLIHNKNGFIAGIMKRFRGGQSNDNDVSQTKAVQRQLPPSVQVALEQLFASHAVAREELDSRCLQQLAGLEESVALDCIRRFQRADLGPVTNKSGFFVGIIKRTQHETEMQPIPYMPTTGMYASYAPLFYGSAQE